MLSVTTQCHSGWETRHKYIINTGIKTQAMQCNRSSSLTSTASVLRRLLCFAMNIRKQNMQLGSKLELWKSIFKVKWYPVKALKLFFAICPHLLGCSQGLIQSNFTVCMSYKFTGCQSYSVHHKTPVLVTEWQQHLGWERLPRSSSPTIPQHCQIPLNHIPKSHSTPLPSDLKRKGNLPYGIWRAPSVR